MAVFQVEKDGKRYEVEAPDMQAAMEALGASSGTGDERPNGLSVFNEGIARGLGTPVDLATSALNAGIGAANHIPGVELPQITDPVGGSASISRGMETLGIDMPDPDYQADGVVENLLLGTGSAAGGLGPFMGAGKALQAGTGLTKAAGQAMMQPFTAAPIRAVSSELASGAGAGLGMDVADQLAPDNPLAQMAGAVVGGGVAGAGPYVAGQTAKRLPGVSAATRFAQSELAPFTEAGAMERARNRVSNLVEDPEAARANLNKPSISNLSPATATADRRLMALERQVRDTDPEADLRMRQMEAEGSELLRNELVAPANGVDSATARNFMEGTVRQQVDGLGQALDDTLGAPVGVESVSTALRTGTAGQRRNAYETAYAQPIDYSTDAGVELEDLIYRVEQVAPGAISMANRMMAGEGIRSNQIKATVADDGTITFTRLPDLRQLDYLTRALNQMAESGDGRGAFGGQTDIGRVISNLSRAVRRNLKEANPAYAEALQTAATPIGQRKALLLGQDLLKPGTHRDLAAQQIADLSEPELQFARQGLRSQLDEALANVRTAMSNPNADIGMREAQQALAQLSSRAAREKISLLLSPEQADAFFAQIDNAAGMLDPRRSGVALFAGARPNEEIRALFNSQDPRTATAQLVQQASQDASGQALAGLKGGFFDELMSRARTGSFDDSGEAVLSGRAMRNTLGNNRVQAVANSLLTMEERSRLSAIVDELTRVETASGRLPGVSAVMEGEPNSIVSLVARTFAARTGAHAGRGASGASLLTAHFASERMKRILQALTLDKAEALIRQAVTGDRELFEALLTPADQISRKQESRLADVLGATGAGIISASAGEMVADDETDGEGGEDYGDPMLNVIMRGHGAQKKPSTSDLEFESYLQNMF